MGGIVFKIRWILQCRQFKIFNEDLHFDEKSTDGGGGGGGGGREAFCVRLMKILHFQPKKGSIYQKLMKKYLKGEKINRKKTKSRYPLRG